jgi:hypothetical protein
MRPLLYVVAALVAGLALTAIVASTLQMLEASRHAGDAPMEAAGDRQPGSSP